MESNELRVSSKKFPPEVAEAFKRLGLPNRVLISDLRIVCIYFETLQEIQAIANNGRSQ